jgi:NADH dehydrogenase
MSGERPHVVIVGAGFGGLYAARTLERAQVRLTVVDRKNHHTFQPLLYQVATAGLNPSDIASPIRSILRHQKNTEVLLADVARIDTAQKRLQFSAGGELHYDVLVIAAGAAHSYFGHDEWERFAPGLKTIEDALEIRKRVLYAFEAAECERDEQRRRAWLTFVIIGAGPTGVELAGTLSEVARHTLASDFRHIDPTRARILLLEGGPRVLPVYPPELSQKAELQLRALHVDVRTGALVTQVDESGVSVGDEHIEAATVLWAAGVAASPLAKTLGAPLDRAGRVLVEPDLTVPGHDDVYVIGDLASLKQEDGRPVPGVAPAAIQEGRHTARNIVRRLHGEPTLPFRYHDKGSLATIGRAAAVAEIGKTKLSGFVAWLAWLLIHIFFLIGFRNRFLVLTEWALSYVTYQRGARLITGALPTSEKAERARERPRRVGGYDRSAATTPAAAAAPRRD